MLGALTETSPLPEILIRRVAHVDLRWSSEPWHHAVAHREAITVDWAARCAANATLFNGRFFILTRFRLTEDSLTGTCAETDYASFLHWRGLAYPSPGWNAFAMAAIHSADGGLLLGQMAPWTSNAGIWYPPAGSIEAEDVRPDGTIDLHGNMCRELREEIGFVPPLDRAAPWTVIIERGRMALLRPVTLAMPSADVEATIRDHIASETQPELSDIRFVQASDLPHLRTQTFISAYLAHQAEET